MTSTLFLVFVALTAAILIAGIAHYLNRRTALGVLAALSVWLIYTGALASFGVLSNTTMRPPGIVFLGVPVVLFLIFFIVRTSAKTKLALAFPLWILIGAQSFRIIVELFLHQLWLEQLVPKMLTFNGANLDIYIGATAPLIAWASTRSRRATNIVLAWNLLGLLVLANVVVRAVLTTPGPLNLIHAEIPDRMLSTFPFLFIPAFFVPLAVVLHTLAIRTTLAGSQAKN